MAITVKQLAVHLRVSADPNQDVPEPHRTIITQLHTWANGVVDNRAPGAPDHARDMAVIMLAGYVHDKPPSSRGAAYGNSWENSGAANVLRAWTTRRGIILDDGNPDAPIAVGHGTSIIWGR